MELEHELSAQTEAQIRCLLQRHAEISHEICQS